MHPRIFQHFEDLCAARNAGGEVLEIGAVPTPDSLLNLEALAGATRKVGVNLDGPHVFRDFHIERGNANRLPFEDDSFDVVLCNATLEHDKYFWKSIAEMKRVARPGALIAIGTPGYTYYRLEHLRFYLLKVLRWTGPLGRALERSAVFNVVSSTVTLMIHAAPGDYYRFSAQAYEEVFFEGLDEVEVTSIMVPPRIIGCGRVPTAP